MKIPTTLGLTCLCTLIYAAPAVADSCTTFWESYPDAQPVTIDFADKPKGKVTISSYQIALLEHNGATWKYGFCEQGGKNLSHWVLSIPNCVASSSEHDISSYDPLAGGDIESVDIGPDSSINKVSGSGVNLMGIKWNTKEDFASGVFTIVLDDNYAEGQVMVAAKAGNPEVTDGVRYGFDTAMLVGPDCSNMAGASDDSDGGGDGDGDGVKLQVSLDSFTTMVLQGRILLEWATGAEMNSLGMYVWRAEPINTSVSMCSSTNPADYVSGSIKALTLINSYGDTTAGQRYFHVDYEVTAGVTYCYLLVEIESDGNLIPYSNDMALAIAQ